MSEATKATLESALIAHLQDENILRDGELLTEWLTLAACLPAERTPTTNAIYAVVAPHHAMAHHTLGLASWYLFERRNDDRD